MSPIQAVIFDVEGTLVDCVPLVMESWRETLHAAGHFINREDLHTARASVFWS
jgi:beta-phosphoglucomutase-like phosphatase (HAD superfamily)